MKPFNNYRTSCERVIYAARLNSGISPEQMQSAYDEHLKIVQGISMRDELFAKKAM